MPKYVLGGKNSVVPDIDLDKVDINSLDMKRGPFKKWWGKATPIESVDVEEFYEGKKIVRSFALHDLVLHVTEETVKASEKMDSVPHEYFWKGYVMDIRYVKNENKKTRERTVDVRFLVQWFYNKLEAQKETKHYRDLPFDWEDMKDQHELYLSDRISAIHESTLQESVKLVSRPRTGSQVAYTCRWRFFTNPKIFTSFDIELVRTEFEKAVAEAKHKPAATQSTLKLSPSKPQKAVAEAKHKPAATQSTLKLSPSKPQKAVAEAKHKPAATQSTLTLSPSKPRRTLRSPRRSSRRKLGPKRTVQDDAAVDSDMEISESDAPETAKDPDSDDDSENDTNSKADSKQGTVEENHTDKRRRSVRLQARPQKSGEIGKAIDRHAHETNSDASSDIPVPQRKAKRKLMIESEDSDHAVPVTKPKGGADSDETRQRKKTKPIEQHRAKQNDGSSSNTTTTVDRWFPTGVFELRRSLDLNADALSSGSDSDERARKSKPVRNVKSTRGSHGEQGNTNVIHQGDNSTEMFLYSRVYSGWTDAIATRLCKSKVLAIVGAGISVSANLPVFRGTNAAKEMKDLFSCFYRRDHFEQWLIGMENLRLQMEAAQPTETHLLLKLLMDENILHTVYTTNIDGLEGQVGLKCSEQTKDVLSASCVQLHGCIRWLSCSRVPYHIIVDGEYAAGERCPLCNDVEGLRPRQAKANGILSHDVVLERGPNARENFIRQRIMADCNALKGTNVCILIMGSSMKSDGVRQVVKDFIRVFRQVQIQATTTVIWVNRQSAPSWLRKRAQTLSCYNMDADTWSSIVKNTMLSLLDS
ncbi:hypothetical protein FRC02_011749 [Tulasnella sp. 418]|nr:hypothetical protein FRC02_011749 [Tulasnella sp. 418]